MIINASLKAGLTGGLYVDYPNSGPAKKYYLILSTAIEGKLAVIKNHIGKEDNQNQHTFQ